MGYYETIKRYIRSLFDSRTPLLIQTEISTTRSVVLIYPLGIVLKFPQIDFKKGLRLFISLFNEIQMSFKEKDFRHVKHFCKWRIFAHYERPESLGYWWLRGILANVNEFRYFVFNSRNPLMVPTYFSLFGLVNIQPLVIPKAKGYGANKIWNLCYAATDIENEMRDCDTHAWEDQNFTQAKDGTIALFDYGSSRAWPMVKKYGDRFSKILIDAQT